ncbi:MAG TPA: hypothetical protein DDY73_11660 [Coprobacter fastidiosus]|uniref:Uncharacterized protein n=1 Tax=Coprobacter fastidiosus TaxID=1099853 RepID=A0A354M557_9BACT|nr:hypothetical protein [Coprobacter fastidiosus]
MKSQIFLIFEPENKTLKLNKMNKRTFEIKNRPKQTKCNIFFSFSFGRRGEKLSEKIVQIVISTLQKINFFLSLPRLTEQ